MNGLCSRSMFTAPWFATMFFVMADTEGPKSFYHAKRQWWTRNLEQSLLWKTSPCCHDWSMFDSNRSMYSHCVNFWFGLDMLPDAGIRHHVANVPCSMSTVPCSMPAVLCSMSTVCTVYNKTIEQWTLNFSHASFCLPFHASHCVSIL